METNEVLELVAAEVHDEWMRGKRAKGITSRPSESGEEQMVPYAQLSEAVKDLDRGSVRATLDALKRCGFELTKAVS